MSEVFSSEQVAPVLESALRVWQEARGNVQLCTLCEKGSEPGGQEVERWILKSAFSASPPTHQTNLTYVCVSRT